MTQSSLLKGHLRNEGLEAFLPCCRNQGRLRKLKVDLVAMMLNSMQGPLPLFESRWWCWKMAVVMDVVVGVMRRTWTRSYGTQEGVVIPNLQMPFVFGLPHQRWKVLPTVEEGLVEVPGWRVFDEGCPLRQFVTVWVARRTYERVRSSTKDFGEVLKARGDETMDLMEVLRAREINNWS